MLEYIIYIHPLYIYIYIQQNFAEDAHKCLGVPGFERNFGTLILTRKWRDIACSSARRAK